MPSLINGAVITLQVPPRTPVVLKAPPNTPPALTVVRGPRGPAGASGDLGTEIVQSAPAATWTFAVPPGFDRTPAVAVYVDGQLVIADVTADATTVSVQFPNPTAGSAVLT